MNRLSLSRPAPVALSVGRRGGRPAQRSGPPSADTGRGWAGESQTWRDCAGNATQRACLPAELGTRGKSGAGDCIAAGSSAACLAAMPLQGLWGVGGRRDLLDQAVWGRGVHNGAGDHLQGTVLPSTPLLTSPGCAPHMSTHAQLRLPSAYQAHAGRAEAGSLRCQVHSVRSVRAQPRGAQHELLPPLCAQLPCAAAGHWRQNMQRAQGTCWSRLHAVRAATQAASMCSLCLVG